MSTLYTNHDALVGNFKYADTISKSLVIARDFDYSAEIITNNESFSLTFTIKKLRVISGAVIYYKIYYRKYNTVTKQWAVWTEAIKRKFYCDASSINATDVVQITNSNFVLDDGNYGTYENPPLYQFRIDFFDGFDLRGKLDSTSVENLTVLSVNAINSSIIDSVDEFYIHVDAPNTLITPGQMFRLEAIATNLYIIESSIDNNGNLQLLLSLIPDNIDEINWSAETKINLTQETLNILLDTACKYTESANILIIDKNKADAYFKAYPNEVLSSIYAVPFVKYDNSYAPELPNTFNANPIILNTEKLNISFYLPISAKEYITEWALDDYSSWQSVSSEMNILSKVTLQKITNEEHETSFDFLNNVFYNKAYIKVYVFVPNSDTITSINNIDFYPTTDNTNGKWYFHQQIKLMDIPSDKDIKTATIDGEHTTPEIGQTTTSYTDIKFKSYNLTLRNLPRKNSFFIWLGIGFFKPLDFNSFPNSIKNIEEWHQ